MGIDSLGGATPDVRDAGEPFSESRNPITTMRELEEEAERLGVDPEVHLRNLSRYMSPDEIAALSSPDAATVYEQFDELHRDSEQAYRDALMLVDVAAFDFEEDRRAAQELFQIVRDSGVNVRRGVPVANERRGDAWREQEGRLPGLRDESNRMHDAFNQLYELAQEKVQRWSPAYDYGYERAERSGNLDRFKELFGYRLRPL